MKETTPDSKAWEQLQYKLNTAANPDDVLMTSAETAAYLGITLNALQCRNKNKRPKMLRVGKKVRYRKSDVDAWLNSNNE